MSERVTVGLLCAAHIDQWVTVPGAGGQLHSVSHTPVATYIVLRLDPTRTVPLGDGHGYPHDTPCLIETETEYADLFPAQDVPGQLSLLEGL